MNINKQLVAKVAKKYLPIVDKRVREGIPSIIKSIGKPSSKSINPAIWIRQKILEDYTILIRKSTNDKTMTIAKSPSSIKIVAACTLILADFLLNTLLFDLLFKRLAKSKLADTIGKILVHIGLKFACMKAGLDQSIISSMSDEEKLIRYKTIIYLPAVSEYDEAINNSIELTDIRKVVIKSTGKETYGSIGAFAFIGAFAGSLNEESSKRVAQDEDITGYYFTIFNIFEFSLYVRKAADTARAIKVRAVSVAIHGIFTLLHKMNLSWAGYMAHFMFNILAPTTVMSTTNKANLARILGE